MNAQEKLNDDIVQLQHNLENLAKHFGAVSRSKVRRLRDTASDVKDEAGEKLHTLIEETNMLIDKCRDGVVHTKEVVEDTVEKHPVATVLAALGVGLLVGKLLDLGKQR